jgi:hypothetical protein
VVSPTSVLFDHELVDAASVSTPTSDPSRKVALELASPDRASPDLVFLVKGGLVLGIEDLTVGCATVFPHLPNPSVTPIVSDDTTQ